MDSPLVLTSILDPAEVDDQVHGMDVEWNYPLELYEAALEMKDPWEVKYGVDQKKIEQLGDNLGNVKQYENFGFTHLWYAHGRTGGPLRQGGRSKIGHLDTECMGAQVSLFCYFK